MDVMPYPPPDGAHWTRDKGLMGVADDPDLLADLR